MSSISSATQRLILKPLAGQFLDFKISCSDLAEARSVLNGLVDVVFHFGEPRMKEHAYPLARYIMQINYFNYSHICL